MKSLQGWSPRRFSFFPLSVYQFSTNCHFILVHIASWFQDVFHPASGCLKQKKGDKGQKFSLTMEKSSLKPIFETPFLNY
jgi:hypothetical protein